jgi:hypothetical protein
LPALFQPDGATAFHPPFSPLALLLLAEDGATDFQPLLLPVFTLLVFDIAVPGAVALELLTVEAEALR